MRKISKIERKIPQMPSRKKVAAYARVSMETERLHHSLSAQISYYSDLIQKHPDWEYAGVYADDGISGTRAESRTEFNRLLADCEAGKIDIVLTKSISRFARNTVDLLETVRHLKELGISVRFEKERIDSMTEDGELMLTLLASFAQEESRSISENVKWGTRKRFEQGIPNGRFNIYGYRWEGDHLVIQPEEAAIVRLIFDNFLAGLSAETTEKQLAEMGVKSYKGQHFGNTSIRQILGNITYTGNLLFQKEFVVDPISGKSKKNDGELPQYFVENTHEAIIPMEVYQAVQDEKMRRRELGALANWSINTSCFTSKIKCGRCGKSYQRSNRKGRKDPSCNYTIWVCGTRKKTGNADCQNKDIPETMLKEACASVLGLAEFDETIFSEQIDHIEIPAPNEMVFYFKDGRIVPHRWESTMRKDCWTDERRAAKGRYVQEHQLGPNSSCFTSRIRCDHCGENYRRQRSRRKDGSYVSVWRCASAGGCDSPSIKEETLKQLCAEALGSDGFDETSFREQIACIHITAPFRLSIHFFDGHTFEGEWENKRQMPKHSEERKAHMSMKMKENWRKRRGESNDNSGNDQPVHSDTD
jgi:site-specific DNA recombinase|nr:MAG TPA: integrase [Caudoviricetes sp.]